MILNQKWRWAYERTFDCSDNETCCHTFVRTITPVGICLLTRRVWSGMCTGGVGSFIVCATRRDDITGKKGLEPAPHARSPLGFSRSVFAREKPTGLLAGIFFSREKPTGLLAVKFCGFVFFCFVVHFVPIVLKPSRRGSLSMEKTSQVVPTKNSLLNSLLYFCPI